MSKPLILDPSKLTPTPAGGPRCAKCGTRNPNLGFNLKGADLGLIGTVQFFVIFCAAEVKNPTESADATPELCGAIVAVNIVQYQPPSDPARLQELARMLAGGGNAPA